MGEHRLEESNGKEKFLGDLFYWCFRWGCEVQLRNKAYRQPVMRPGIDPFAMGENHEVQADGSIVDMIHRMKVQEIEIPELVFSKGDRHISIVAQNWEALIRRTQHEYKRVFMDLSVPLMPGWEQL